MWSASSDFPWFTFGAVVLVVWLIVQGYVFVSVALRPTANATTQTEAGRDAAKKQD